MPPVLSPVFGGYHSKAFPLLLSCQAVYVQPKSCHRSSWLAPEYLDAYFSVSRFYSNTSSFLKIVSEPKQLPCNQEKMISVLYSLNPEAYKDDSDVNFVYLVSLSWWVCPSNTAQFRGCHLSGLVSLSKIHRPTLNTPGSAKSTGASLQNDPRLFLKHLLLQSFPHTSHHLTVCERATWKTQTNEQQRKLLSFLLMK